MVPTIIFVLVDDSILPKTSTGKVQRMATLAKLTAAGIEPTLEASIVRHSIYLFACILIPQYLNVAYVLFDLLNSLLQLDARIISSFDFVPPESALEEATVQIWQKVIQLLLLLY
jgi:hypothetical protein